MPPLRSNTALRAEMLVRALAKVGIIALVDEATGYQDIRDQDTLHARPLWCSLAQAIHQSPCHT